MHIEANSLMFILSIIAMFIYQISSFSYATSLLIGGIKNKWLFAFLALINSSLYALVQYIDLPLFLMLLSYLIVFLIEFKLVSKTDFIQVICGASIFVLHLAAFSTPIVIIFSNIYKVPPVELLKGTACDYFIVIIVCIILTFAHELVKKFIDNTSIQRVTVKSKHSILLLASIFLIITVQLYHTNTMIGQTYFPEQIFLSIAISLSAMLLFYLFFIYSINLVDANIYKRYSDKILDEHKKITEKKETLMTKIERDDLTGVFTRGYIMNCLEELCDDKDNSSSFFVLFIDINALKFTNDTYGHNAGDRLIKKIAHALSNAVREDDIIARIGGDEFLVLLTEPQANCCESIVDRINHYIELENKTEEFLVSASIGWVYVDKQIKEQGVSYILSTADENMRKNKARFYNKKEVSRI